jgi:hypothetical protein
MEPYFDAATVTTRSTTTITPPPMRPPARAHLLCFHRLIVIHSQTSIPLRPTCVPENIVLGTRSPLSRLIQFRPFILHHM